MAACEGDGSACLRSRRARWQAYDWKVADAQEYLEDEHHSRCAVRCALGPYGKQNGREDVANGKPGRGRHEQEAASVTIDRLVSVVSLECHQIWRKAYP